MAIAHRGVNKPVKTATNIEVPTVIETTAISATARLAMNGLGTWTFTVVSEWDTVGEMPVRADKLSEWLDDCCLEWLDDRWSEWLDDCCAQQLDDVLGVFVWFFHFNERDSLVEDIE